MEVEDMDFLETGAGAGAGAGASAVPMATALPVPAAAAAIDLEGGSTSRSGGNGGVGGGVVQVFQSSSHPVAALFHVAFKVVALFLYIFGTWFSESFVVIFVLCVVFLSFDFWTVKNVTGRLMVGLRWWSEMDDDGNNQWRFESIENLDEVSVADYRIFWYSLYGNLVIWLILGFFSILQFTWLLLVGVAIALTGSNIYGYWQCSKDAQQRLQGAMQGVMQQTALAALSSSVSSMFGKRSAGTTGAVAET